MDEKKNFFEKLKAGLSKTRNTMFSGIFSSEERVDDEFFDALEEAMILADMGMETTEKLLLSLRERVKNEKITDREIARQCLIEAIAAAMTVDRPFLPDVERGVLLIVGVNGVGKTTSIGKIANQYKQAGRQPLLAAADTFRAAAAEQLGEWAKRADVPMVRHGEGADPSAVVFDAIASFKAKKCDLLICDTAGRLHNKANLMNELSKMRRIIERELPELPCEVLLVLDATTGQNAVAQAKAFSEVCDLTGVILTKLDGTAKGGVVVAIADTLHIPVRFIGVGEKIDDLQKFDPEQFAKALFSAENA